MKRSRLRLLPAARQRGAAVLMALFVAALAVIIVSGLFWNQFVLVRTIENQLVVAQSRLLLRGALDWARAILREDRNAQDTLAEPWAQGLAETRLDQLGETSTLASQATLSGSIDDAQARFNLRNLVTPDGEVDTRERDVLRKLASLLQVSEAVADVIALRMQQAWQAPTLVAPDAGGSATGSAPHPIPLLFSQDLAAVPGVDPESAARLAPYVVVLDQPTPINLNTAAAEVIAARFPSMSLADARALVAERERSYFVNTGDVRLARFRRDSELGDLQIAVSSRYFIARGQVRLDRAQTRMEALLRRDGPQPVRILWQREL